jgi:hypothetical protein
VAAEAEFEEAAVRRWLGTAEGQSWLGAAEGPAQLAAAREEMAGGEGGGSGLARGDTRRRHEKVKFTGLTQNSQVDPAV